MQQRSKDLEFIQFNGKNSLDYNIGIVSRTGILGSAERDVSTISVPGKDGDLLVDNGRYKNVEVSFESYLLPDSPQFKDEYELFKLCQLIKDWLSVYGYYKLVSSKQPGYYRIARLSNKLDISDVYFQIGSCTLKFDCYPYIYNVSGDVDVLIKDCIENHLFNNENEESLPIINVVGSGNVTLEINEERYIIQNINGGVIIDSEREIAYNEENQIQYGILQATKFPKLKIGDNVINATISKGIDKITIKPKWRSR